MLLAYSQQQQQQSPPEVQKVMKDELELRTDLKKRKSTPPSAAEVIDMMHNNDEENTAVYNPSAPAKLMKGPGDRDIRVSSFCLLFNDKISSVKEG